MARIAEVNVQALPIDRLAGVVGPEREAAFGEQAAAARTLFDGRTNFHVNSTAAGGGVAEMLQTLLAYARGVGVDARWLVIQGDPEFFTVTKRIHNHLYGAPGDGGPLGAAERKAYEATLHENALELRAVMRSRDIVVLHDPQTLGLASTIKSLGATVVWRCHVGVDTPNEYSEKAWQFLRPYLEEVDASVFTRRAFAPSWADPARVHVIAPSIDPFSTKNRDLSADETGRVLRYVGLVSDGVELEPVHFIRRDGSPGRVEYHADILQTGPPPPPSVPLVVQVSRWDRMKDMPGVMVGFAEHIDSAHLVLAGPVVTGVTDDPEGGQVLEECVGVWRSLPHAVRSRVHLACIPMHDPDENATIVNALQRHAAIVTQKSFAEGFGLTVVEAMWKARPIVASAVGGISDQIVDGEHGLLLDDPTDLPAFGRAVGHLLDDRAFAEKLGANARRRVTDEFLGDRHLEQWAALFVALEDGAG